MAWSQPSSPDSIERYASEYYVSADDAAAWDQAEEEIGE